MEIEEMCSKLTLSRDVARPVVYRDMTLCTEKQHARNSELGNLRYGKRLQTSLLATGNGALDETVGTGLRSVDLGVLAGVLDALVPAEICKEKVLVRNGLLNKPAQESGYIPISK
jgi:hypothetical protein